MHNYTHADAHMKPFQNARNDVKTLLTHLSGEPYRLDVILQTHGKLDKGQEILGTRHWGHTTTPPYSGTDDGVIPPPPPYSGTDDGVIPSPPPYSGTDDGIIPPPPPYRGLYHNFWISIDKTNNCFTHPGMKIEASLK